MKFKKYAIATLFLFMLPNIINGQENQKQADEATFKWEYDIECYGGTGKQGYKIVKVWTYAEEKSLAIQQAKKNAPRRGS